MAELKKKIHSQIQFHETIPEKEEGATTDHACWAINAPRFISICQTK